MRFVLGGLIAATLFTSPAHAALFLRGGGTMVYDDVLDVTWAADAGPIFGDVSSARAYAAALSLGGFSDWRLPSAFDLDGSLPCAGYGCVGNELGYMHYVNFGAMAGQNSFAGSNAANIALFTNTGGANLFALGEDFTAANAGGNDTFGCDMTVGAESCTWVFRNDGLQSYGGRVQPFKAWALRDGDVLGAGGIPEPQTWMILIAGMIATGGAMRRAGVRARRASALA